MSAAAEDASDLAQSDHASPPSRASQDRDSQVANMRFLNIFLEDLSDMRLNHGIHLGCGSLHMLARHAPGKLSASHALTAYQNGEIIHGNR